MTQFFAIQRPDGTLIVDTQCATESAAWTTALPFAPPGSNIYSLGYRCIPVHVLPANKCSTCNSTGRYRYSKQYGECDVEEWEDACPVCGGNGYVLPEAPEPVAWRYRYWKGGAWRFADRAADPEDIDGDYEEQPLYLGAPPSTIRQEDLEALQRRCEWMEKALRDGNFDDYAFLNSLCDECGGRSDMCSKNCYVRRLAALMGDKAALAGETGEEGGIDVAM